MDKVSLADFKKGRSDFVLESGLVGMPGWHLPKWMAMANQSIKQIGQTPARAKICSGDAFHRYLTYLTYQHTMTTRA